MTRSFIAAIFCIILLSHSARLRAQVSISDSVISLTLLDIVYVGQFTGADLAAQTGYSSQLGLDAHHKFRSQWYAGGGVHVFFSESVKSEGLLGDLLTPDELLVANNGTLTGVNYLVSGFVVPLSVGRIFPVIEKHNLNSGLYVEGGIQYLQHKVNYRLRGDPVAALSGEYLKGYDRLSSGWGLRQAFGYRYLDSKGLLNLSFGLDISENFTRGRRSLNYATGLPGNQRRIDLLYGFHACWTFPLYNRAPNKTYYY
jgi:hypothetical protein